MTDQPRSTIHKFHLPDTGIGRAAGYENDDA